MAVVLVSFIVDFERVFGHRGALLKFISVQGVRLYTITFPGVNLQIFQMCPLMI